MTASTADESATCGVCSMHLKTIRCPHGNRWPLSWHQPQFSFSFHFAVAMPCSNLCCTMMYRACEVVKATKIWLIAGVLHAKPPLCAKRHAIADSFRQFQPSKVLEHKRAVLQDSWRSSLNGCFDAIVQDKTEKSLYCVPLSCVAALGHLFNTYWDLNMQVFLYFASVQMQLLQLKPMTLRSANKWHRC